MTGHKIARRAASSNLLPRFVAQFVDRMNGIFLSFDNHVYLLVLSGPRLHQPSLAARASARRAKCRTQRRGEQNEGRTGGRVLKGRRVATSGMFHLPAAS